MRATIRGYMFLRRKGRISLLRNINTACFLMLDAKTLYFIKYDLCEGLQRLMAHFELFNKIGKVKGSTFDCDFYSELVL
jgi:hypothetical protein